MARTDPVTGEKINKMRKSYEGKIKSFGLAGRNKAVKHEPGKSAGLMELVQWPDEEWHNQKVVGKEVEKGLGDALLAKLDRAMKMEPGPVPNNEIWEDLLGHEKAKQILAPADVPAKKSIPNPTNTVRPNIQSNTTNTIARAAGEVARPKRSGKKRRYDEDSFEGYGEGYVDDDGDPGGAGYSSGDGEGSRRGGSSKKKRKMVGFSVPAHSPLGALALSLTASSEQDYSNTRPPGFSERGGSYGVGMVGIGSGIEAYGR